MQDVRWVWIIALVLLVGAGDAMATQTSVPFFECRNCTDTQMRQAALDHPGLGVRIVYNLASAHIFKYNVYLEAGCLNGPIGGDPDQLKTRGSTVTPDNNCNPNPSRQIDSLTVDAALHAPFDAMIDLYQEDPILLATAKARVDIGDLGADPQHPGQAFDPREVSYDRGTGPTFQNFIDRVTDEIDNPNSGFFQSHPNLVSLFVNVLGPLDNMVVSLGFPGGISVALDPQDQAMDATIEFVADDGSFARVEFHRTGGHWVPTYEGAFDSTGVPLPTSTEVVAPGFHRDFHGPGGTGNGNGMGNSLHGFGGYSFIQNWSACTQKRLTCNVVSPLHMECTLDCVP